MSQFTQNLEKHEYKDVRKEEQSSNQKMYLP